MTFEFTLHLLIIAFTFYIIIKRYHDKLVMYRHAAILQNATRRKLSKRFDR